MRLLRSERKQAPAPERRRLRWAVSKASSFWHCTFNVRIGLQERFKMRSTMGSATHGLARSNRFPRVKGAKELKRIGFPKGRGIE